MKIKLAETNSILSGRTAAELLISSLSVGAVDEIDFSGVESPTQSFASELIRSLIRNKFDIDTIVFSNMNDRCSERINTEKKRIKEILARTTEL